MEAGKYRLLLWQLIGALDTGNYDKLSIDDVTAHARAGASDSFLKKQFGANFDFSTMKPEDWLALNERWLNIENAVDVKRKFGVENKGIALLIAYTLECFQSLDNAGKNGA